MMPPEPMTSAPSVDVVTSLLLSSARLDVHEWDALVVDEDFFHCHGWLNALDDALGPAGVIVARGDAGLLGGCAIWDGEREPGLFHLPDFFPDVRGPWSRAFLWIGARRSTHNELPAVQGWRRLAALRAVLSAARDLATARQCAGAIVPYMPLARALEAARICPDARVLLHSDRKSVV